MSSDCPQNCADVALLWRAADLACQKFSNLTFATDKPYFDHL